MPRKRTGTLVPKPSGYFARMWITRDGVERREFVNLETKDKALAKRKMAKIQRMLDAGELIAEAKASVGECESVADFAEAWLTKRKARGVLSEPEERGYLKRYILPHLPYPLDAVRPIHVREVLDAAIATGRLRQGTISHLHRIMGRMFKSAWEDEVIKENPVLRVKVPPMREVRFERVILTDAEVERFMACPDVDLELRMLSLVSRVEGGMRTGDLVRWCWSYIDVDTFAECTIPRAKTERPQRLQIPEVLAPFLRAWWERQGSPRVGPVFPSRRGVRKGGFKAPRGNGFARRLRRGLLKAGIVRHEVHNPTATTLPVDFHSFRRAFASALAGAEVSAQHAMKLTGHSSAAVHARYVMDTPAMRLIPTRALPQVTALPVPDKPKKATRGERRSKEPDAIVESPAGDNSKRVTQNHYGIQGVDNEPTMVQGAAPVGETVTAFPLTSRMSQVQSLSRPPFSIGEQRSSRVSDSEFVSESFLGR
jgi:integrase